MKDALTCVKTPDPHDRIDPGPYAEGEPDDPTPEALLGRLRKALARRLGPG